jgi:hypothetical protein
LNPNRASDAINTLEGGDDPVFQLLTLGTSNLASRGGIGVLGLSDNGAKYTFGQLRNALTKVFKQLNIDKPINEKVEGKFGSPMRDDGTKGYRLDPPHPNASKRQEQVPHINWWDRTLGKKRNKGLREDAEPIIDPD